jgi:Uri superfamily endonuclease
MKDEQNPLPLRGTVPCDKCLNQFIATRHLLHQQIKRWQQDYAQMKAENDRLRARNAELVEAEIKLRLDHQHPHTVTLGPKLRHAISKREASAS